VPEEQYASDEPVKKASRGTHTVTGGETLFSLGRTYGVSPYAIADLNGLPHDQSLNVGQQLRMPSGTRKSIVAKVPAAEESEQIVSSEELVENDETPQNLALKKPLLDEEIPVVKPVPQQTAELEARPAMGGMRWPVKGKIISEYGAKPNGLKNEGINIAVPEGTGVRAAESGVVAYAGNELKGYGNLVLIRHEGGWVTAYAHAKELFVKRGDIVKRGDVIAKAGQTGSVSSPQLHFEVRKGATAMDPMKFLASTTASN
jgi:murein DD-endopeptidase MepM/ murein hydrolase activator NlpD